jgi:hypothetical protein
MHDDDVTVLGKNKTRVKTNIWVFSRSLHLGTMVRRLTVGDMIHDDNVTTT